MSEQPVPPGVIPYVEAHTGPKKVITVTLTLPSTLLSGMTASQVMPNVFLDGRQYVVYWGTVAFQVPADRPVHIGVGMQDGLRGASILLPASPDPVALEYRVPAMGRVFFGPAGQAR